MCINHSWLDPRNPEDGRRVYIGRDSWFMRDSPHGAYAWVWRGGSFMDDATTMRQFKQGLDTSYHALLTSAYERGCCS